MKNNTKPILHIIFTKRPTSASYLAYRKLAQTLKERYYDKYDVIISTDGLDIIPDNSTVVKLTIDTSENIENVIKYIDNIPSYDKTLGIESSIKVRDEVVTSSLDGDEIAIENNLLYVNHIPFIEIKTGIDREPSTNIPEMYAALKTHTHQWNNLVDIHGNNSNDGFESFIIGEDNIKSFIIALEDIASKLRNKLLSGGEKSDTQKQQDTMVNDGDSCIKN